MAGQEHEERIRVDETGQVLRQAAADAAPAVPAVMDTPATAAPAAPAPADTSDQGNIRRAIREVLDANLGIVTDFARFALAEQILSKLPTELAAKIETNLADTNAAQQWFEDETARELIGTFLPLVTTAVPTGVAGPNGQQEQRTTINFGQAAYLAYTGARALWQTRAEVRSGRLVLDVATAAPKSPGSIQ